MRSRVDGLLWPTGPEKVTSSRRICSCPTTTLRSRSFGTLQVGMELPSGSLAVRPRPSAFHPDYRSGVELLEGV